ncbi:endoplasmic reticulum vesicle transporter-domain-containing protein [Mycotypha africana]|uniref:endoplasmic reticulum vesicle transporter-domain-containing protein n=1 Tax=Mycotypha africana TaxID=64632 RepID=UPI002301BC85|nr:endoplasmic reticulum vesicle transporter-domain-containing protein [Mycotypha africana]KAI8983926.1 endoplasmic reticulum vesicle transporter-domain-containing protein [Mycotypha africana]
MAKKGSLFRNLKQFDGYAKTLDDFRVKTTSGASVTIISMIIIIALISFEVMEYTTTFWRPSLVVDKSRKEKLPINFNLTFHNMPCYMLNIDIMDENGEHISGFSQDITKVRLTLDGEAIKSDSAELGDYTADASKAFKPSTECGSCYGATPLREDGCCNTCQEVREAYIKQGWGLVKAEKIDQCIREGWLERFEKQSNEGCNIHGHLLVNKVRGNFHFAPGDTFQTTSMHVHDLKEFTAGAPDGHKFDLSHTIHKLRFGPDTQNEADDILAVTDSLSGTSKKELKDRKVFQYFLKIVSTKLFPLNSVPTLTNQYSVIQNDIEGANGGLPGVFFMMEISPMEIIYKEAHKSFGSLLTGILAVIGGVFTVAGLINRIVYRAERAYQKKVQLGKTL